ncbi:MAG: DUF1559 domain-containing protein [Planctomycetes bacterium]|nr:DUF1559 domain-containing protein [Planctomycetota bacterium]
MLAGKTRGFTLVELLVVIAIIGVLVALLLPAVQAAREAARRMQCVNNLKQIGLAMHGYHATHGVLPGGSAIFTPNPVEREKFWSVAIFPYMELQNIYDQLDLSVAFGHLNNEQLVTQVITSYVCPSDPAASDPILEDRFTGSIYSTAGPSRALGMWYPASIGPTEPDGCDLCPAGMQSSDITSPNWCCQASNWGTTALWGYPVGSSVGMFGRYAQSFKFSQVTDGSSNTIMNGETLPGHSVFNSTYTPGTAVGYTTVPINTMIQDFGMPIDWWLTGGFKSMHPGGANFLLGDGSVHFLNETIDHQLYSALGTRAGEDAIGELP